jgi:hypothetical protein
MRYEKKSSVSHGKTYSFCRQRAMRVRCNFAITYLCNDEIKVFLIGFLISHLSSIDILDNMGDQNFRLGLRIRVKSLVRNSCNTLHLCIIKRRMK